MAEIKGLSVLVYVSGVAVANGISNSLTVDRQIIDITSKDGNSWQQSLTGTMNWSIDVEAFVDFSDSNTADDLFTLLTAGAAVTVKMSHEVSSEVYWGGSAFITNLSLNPGGIDDAYSFSCTLTGTSTLSQFTKT